MRDTDIEGLGPKEAAEYVLAFITTLKTTEKDRTRAEEDVALWTRRVSLAQGKGDAELESHARARLTEAESRKQKLETELAELGATVSVLKQKLVRLRTGPQRTVDADLLLAQLEMAVGKKDELAHSMKDEEAKAALDELKKKMGG